MIPSPTLPWFELARFRRSRLTRAAVVAVMLVPLFYGALYVWANIDPTGRLDNVQAAVVNEDELVEVTGPDGEAQPVAIGRQLAGNLVGDDSRHNYDWVLTDARDARQGLANGRYKAVLTLPENLSEAATSTSGDPEDAVQGNLDLKTNDAVNYVNGAIAERILEAAKGALNSQVTETYLDNIYLSFTDIKIALDEAADGAGELADGADELAAGLDELAAGADELARGNRELADGAAQLDAGAGELAAGLGRLDSQTSTLPRDTRRLAEGSARVAEGTAQINELVQGVAGTIGEASGDAEAQAQQLEAFLRQLAAQCRDAGAEGMDCAQLEQAADRTDELVRGIGRVGDEADGAAGQTQQLADGAAQVARGNAELAAAMPALVGAIGEAADGADALAAGTGALAQGAAAAAAGATELADGAARAAEGAEALAAGAAELRDGLRAGAGDVPDYDEDEREQLARTVATPVEDAADRLNPVASYGEALAPYFMALALWVGAMATYLLLRPLSARAIASTAGSVRTALAGFAPGAVISLVQAGLLVAVLLAIVGIGAADVPLLVGMAALTGLVFTAINQMFVAWFGGAGRFLALVFVSLQLTAAGGTYPIETAPGFFGFLHDLLPMTYAVHGLRAATAGGGQGVGTDVVVLLVFLAIALGLTVIAAHRRQVVTMQRLHPTLVV